MFGFTPANIGRTVVESTPRSMDVVPLTGVLVVSHRGLFQFAKLAFVHDQTASSHVHQPEQSPYWSNWYVSTHRHVGNKSVCVMTLEHVQGTPRCAPLCLVDPDCCSDLELADAKMLSVLMPCISVGVPAVQYWFSEGFAKILSWSLDSLLSFCTCLL